MIYSVKMEFKLGQMDQDTKANTQTVKKTVRESSFGLIIHIMKDNFIKIIFKALEFIFGLMEENIKVSGKIIKCKVKAYSLGLME